MPVNMKRPVHTELNSIHAGIKITLLVILMNIKQLKNRLFSFFIFNINLAYICISYMYFHDFNIELTYLTNIVLIHW